MKTPSFIKRLGRCQCDKLSTEHPLHHVPKPGFIERLLMRLVPHFDIIKTVNNCDLCEDSGFTRGATSSSLGPYDRICDDCAGQSTQVDQATLLYLRRFYVFRAKWFGKWAAKHLGDIYLHHIVRNDDDKDPHNHPWGFTTVILARGYLDEQWRWKGATLSFERTDGVLDRKPYPAPFFGISGLYISDPARRVGPEYQRVYPGMILRREAEHCHRVLVGEAGRTEDGKSIKGSAWTLVFTDTPKHHRSWSFITEKGPVDWRTYLGIKE